MYTLSCCLFDPACFFLPSFSHLSLKHVHRYQCMWPGVDLRRLLHSAASGVPRHSDLCLRSLWLQVRGHLVGGFINPRHACTGGLRYLLYVSVCLSVWYHSSSVVYFCDQTTVWEASTFYFLHFQLVDLKKNASFKSYGVMVVLLCEVLFMVHSAMFYYVKYRHS